jgi:Ala-tRNA(Pro) deacylase
VSRDPAHRNPRAPDIQFLTAEQIAQVAPLTSFDQRGGLMPLSKLRDFLDSHHIKYLAISHFLAYTAQGIAALTHVSGKKLAKTVIVKIDGILAMAVVPASAHVDLDRLATLTGAQAVEIASEHEFKNAFPDCETGAMPPFGNLYDMPVYADASLKDNDEFTFNAGTHRELIRMAWDDFAWLVNPTIDNLTHRRFAVVPA